MSVVVILTFRASASLVGYWQFNEGAGTNILDSSGSGNHGVLVNARPDSWTNGYAGNALYFDGTTGSGAACVLIPDSASLHITNAISFAARIRCDDISRDAPILDKEGSGKLSYWFGAFGTGSEGGGRGNFGVLLSVNGQSWAVLDRNQGNISEGVWMHVASTWDGTTIRHYLNGLLLPQTVPFNGLLRVSDAALVIGANYPFNSTSFRGVIDEARLYDHALSQAEVQALVGTAHQLVGRWSFDEADGTNIVDASGLGNHGTLVHPKTNSWTRGVSGSALYFDGTVDQGSTYVAVPDASSLRLSTGLSAAAWVRCDDINRDAPILAKEGDGKLSYWFGAYGLPSDGSGATTPGNFGLLLDADGSQPWTTYGRHQGAIPQGQWVHLASTWDGATLRHYYNGEPLTSTGAFSGPLHISDAFLAIGVNSTYNYTAFKGVIDEVCLYNYPLPPDEIRTLYRSTRFRITSINRVGNDIQLAWECAPGRSYVVQTNVTGLDGSLTGVFGDLSPSIAVPAGAVGTTTNYVHVGGGAASTALYYRVKLLP